MRRKGVSQGDVARLAGVSPTAVSIVLNGKQGAHRIAPDTVQRIHQAMAELRYRPNAVAQALVYGRTNTIGVVLGRADMTYLTNTYFGPALQGIVGFAFAQRRFVLLYHGGELGEADMDAISYMDGRCDGLILTPPFSAARFNTSLADVGFPFVTLGDTGDDPRSPGVDVDNESAAQDLAEYLIGHGHRRILALAMRGYSTSALRRLVGCRRGVERHGGIYEEAFLPRNDERGMLDVLRRCLAQTEGDRPTALFCLTDDIALPVIRLLHEIGMEVPRDISVVGFDDIPAASDARLTTVRQDPVRIGEEATRLLLRLIDRDQRGDSPVETNRVLLPTVLVERESVARLAPG